MSLNLSVRQLEDEALLSQLDQSLLRDLDDKVAVLTAVRQRDATIAIDDFGTGFSSLSRLKHWPINCVNIDRSFVMTIPQQTNDMEITRAVCAPCHALQLKVVAEGVETAEQQQFLQQLGCHLWPGLLSGHTYAIGATGQLVAVALFGWQELYSQTI